MTNYLYAPAFETDHDLEVLEDLETHEEVVAHTLALRVGGVVARREAGPGGVWVSHYEDGGS